MRRIPGLVSITWCIIFFLQIGKSYVHSFFWILTFYSFHLFSSSKWWHGIGNHFHHLSLRISFVFYSCKTEARAEINQFLIIFFHFYGTNVTMVLGLSTRLYSFKVRLAFLRFWLLKNLRVLTDFQRHWVNERNMFDDVLMYIYHLTVTDPLYPIESCENMRKRC